MKFSNKIIALFLATNMVATILCGTDQDIEKSSSSCLESIDKEITKAFSKKNKAKALKKLKKSITPEKEAKIAGQIVNSNATDAQKVALLEILMQAKTELDKIPSDIAE